MASPGSILALDQGTTSSRAIVFAAGSRHPGPRRSASSPSTIRRSGWVEHDPEDIWQTTVETARQAVAAAGLAARDIAAIGITNQRETCLVWDRRTSKPIHRAIVWQDRRTAEMCRALKEAGHEPAVTAKTGLLLDPYFSATKIAWLLDHVEGRARTGASRAPRLRHGRYLSHLAPDRRPRARHRRHQRLAHVALRHRQGDWDDDLLRLFGVPRSLLPEVRDCNADFGTTRSLHSRRRAADPAASPATSRRPPSARPASRRAWSRPPTARAASPSSTPARRRWRRRTACSPRSPTSSAGKRTYALEGAIFIAGAAVQWLRDGLKIIASASESGQLAASADAAQDVYLVPAFVGLGAPYWQPEARGAMFGLTRATGRAEIARAALEAVCFQTRDLLEAMHRDWGAPRPIGAARRRRHGGIRLDHAAPRRHPRRAGRATRGAGDDRAGRGLARRAQGRRVARRGRASPSSGSSSAASGRRSPLPSASASTQAGSGRSQPCLATRTGR